VRVTQRAPRESRRTRLNGGCGGRGYWQIPDVELYRKLDYSVAAADALLALHGSVTYNSILVMMTIDKSFLLPVGSLEFGPQAVCRNHACH
jgi:hypothetical protein